MQFFRIADWSTYDLEKALQGLFLLPITPETEAAIKMVKVELQRRYKRNLARLAKKRPNVG